MSNLRNSKLKLWPVAFLALVSCVLFAQSGALKFFTPSSEPDFVHYVVAPAPDHPATCFNNAVTRDDVVIQADEVSSENEEQDLADPVDDAPAPFVIPSSFRKFHDRTSIAHLLCKSLYRLRC